MNIACPFCGMYSGHEEHCPHTTHDRNSGGAQPATVHPDLYGDDQVQLTYSEQVIYLTDYDPSADLEPLDFNNDKKTHASGGSNY